MRIVPINYEEDLNQQREFRYSSQHRVVSGGENARFRQRRKLFTLGTLSTLAVTFQWTTTTFQVNRRTGLTFH